MKSIFVVVAISVMLSGCFESGTSSSQSVSQSDSCVFSEIKDAKKECKNGQVALFVPRQWGNEQLPILAASFFCDYRYSIVQNNGGVSCIFTDARLKEKPQEKTGSDKKKDETAK